MGDVVRIAPALTDDDLVEWVGYDGATTQAVAGRFSWPVDETRATLYRLQREGRLWSEAKGLRFGEAQTGGLHRVWYRDTRPAPGVKE